MSLKPLPIGPVPQETARLAKAVFPEGSTFIKMRDELGTLYQDEMFAALFPKDGQPALAPWRLALVTIMQFTEGLSDRQAAHAVRARLDWKYALGLELEDKGFDFSVLSEFRSRLHPRGASLMTHPDLSDELRSTLEAHYGLRLDASTPLLGGEEVLIWQVNSSLGPLVVRMSPAHRSPVRLQQIHQVLLALAPVLPPVLAPLLAPDGSTLLSYHGRAVELFPFVSGERLDRENARLRQAAARLLAQVHTALLPQTKYAAALARKSVGGEWLSQTPPDPPGLHDPDLDRWHSTLREPRAAFTVSLIHGDYWRGNLLAQEGQIVALLDWDDLHPDFLIQEVAWASWDFGKTASSDDWHLDRVQAFLQDYREAGGPCKAEEYHAIIPFVRWRLREELRYHHFAQVAAGLPGHPDYADGQVRAFERLRACQAVFI